MKSLIVGLALFIGIVGMAQAGGRQGQGWNVTVVTGTATTIFTGRGYLKAIYTSSGTEQFGTDYLVAFSTPPSAGNGAGVALMPGALFFSTAGLTPPIYFGSSITVSAGLNIGGMNPAWSAGDCETCFIEIPGGNTDISSSTVISGEGRVGGGLHIRKTRADTGLVNTATVLWSK